MTLIIDLFEQIPSDVYLEQFQCFGSTPSPDTPILLQPQLKPYHYEYSPLGLQYTKTNNNPDSVPIPQHGFCVMQYDVLYVAHRTGNEKPLQKGENKSTLPAHSSGAVPYLLSLQLFSHVRERKKTSKTTAKN